MARNESRAVGYRIRALRERKGWDRAELAERVGVHTGSIARWETGGAVPHAYTLERIGELLGAPAHWLRTGREEPPAEPETRAEADESAARPEREAEALFLSLDSMARFLDGIGPPGQERLRKLDALEGLRRLLTARGALPGWWYVLHDRVERGEL